MPFDIIIISLDAQATKRVKNSSFHKISHGYSYEEAINLLSAITNPRDAIVIIDCGIKEKNVDPTVGANHGLSLVLTNQCAKFGVDMVIVGINSLQKDPVSKSLRKQMELPKDGTKIRCFTQQIDRTTVYFIEYPEISRNDEATNELFQIDYKAVIKAFTI